MELYSKSATELACLLRSKKTSAAEIAASFLKRILQIEPHVGAFITLGEEIWLQRAKAIDLDMARGLPLGALAGIPVGIKDNICTKGIATTRASRMLQNFIPPYDATVVHRLKKSNAILAGKLNMDEFAMGSSCETSYNQPTKNPWDLTRVPGGSSGGSAAAVAALELPLALGSDTGGSVRTPASFCGVVGLKPTYGAVSRFGLVAYASSLEQIGPIARTVEDVALLYSIICGADPQHDATSTNFEFSPEITGTVQGMCIGIPKEYFGSAVQPEVAAKVMAAVALLEKQGARVVELSLPATQYALSVYHILSSAEASSNFARFDGVKYGYSGDRSNSIETLYTSTRSEGFGDEVKRRILLGTFVLSSGHQDAYYQKAKQTQRLIAAEFEDAWQQCDCIITPTCPITAFTLGEKLDHPVDMYATDVCTVPANLAGLPAVSVPCGQSRQGLPIGMQLIGPKRSETRLLQIAKYYETAIEGFPTAEVRV